ncbi:MAG: NAD(P)-dependent oxidoreductase [Chromatiales bacterium]|nr:NAD(P)-dependent oxidoreductase [Chromatiales bacterium]
MTTVLITGANGFVGSHALEAMGNEPSLKLIAACRDRTKLLCGFNGEVREGDIRDPAYLDTLFQGVDVLVNCAAWTAAWGHERESEKYFYRPSLKLIDMAIAAGVRRIVNISTTSAAAPDNSADPMSHGIIRSRWPHLNNVIRIENHLRQRADEALTVVNLRFGTFAGARYGLGMLPLLLPRLKTHLVPWVAGGKTSAPLIDGKDIGQAITLASKAELTGYQGFNIVGPEVPTVREVLTLLHDELGYPKPHFGVPFFIAYPFARLMELLDPIVPWEPLVTRSIIHLLEEVDADNGRAEKILGYRPQVHWKDSVRATVNEMKQRQHKAMSMTKPIVE